MRAHVRAAMTGVRACLALGGCGAGTGAPEPGATADLPVVTFPEEADDFPLAGVEGVLELRQGCLVLGGDVVFWPYGATWDQDAEAVVFSDAPHFEDAASAQVGETFSGGGAYYQSPTDFRSWLGDEFADLIDGCRSATDISDVVFAYPSPHG